MGVLPVPNRSDAPDAPVDVVLEQQPAAGTQIRQGDTVFYTVKASGSVSLPDARRRVNVVYAVPQSLRPREVRVDTIDRNGVQQTVFPRPRDFVEGAPPTFASGFTITIPISFVGEMTVEIYLDGAKAQSLYYKDEAEPVITAFNQQ
jgi:hypothetical protein